MFKKIYVIITVWFFAIAISGCASKKFGMDEQQFNSLTPKQQQQVIADYNRRQAAKAELNPLLEAVGVAGRASHVGTDIPFGSSGNYSSTSSSHFSNDGSTWEGSKTTTYKKSGGSVHIGF